MPSLRTLVIELSAIFVVGVIQAIATELQVRLFDHTKSLSNRFLLAS